jgi:hypothetical protein
MTFKRYMSISFETLLNEAFKNILFFISFSSLLEETEAVFEVMYSITDSTMTMFVEQLCNRQMLLWIYTYQY